MTAGEVATATGLGRETVSTTLSKLAKSGEVTKAARGYQLAGQAPAGAPADAAASAESEQPGGIAARPDGWKARVAVVRLQPWRGPVLGTRRPRFGLSASFEAARTTDAGGGRRVRKSAKTEGHQQDSLPRRFLSGGLSPCLGQAATGQDDWPVRCAGARSGRRKSCWARPDSCAGYWWSSRSRAWGARAACRTPLPSEGTAAGRAAARRLTPCRL